MRFKKAQLRKKEKPKVEPIFFKSITEENAEWLRQKAKENNTTMVHVVNEMIERQRC